MINIVGINNHTILSFFVAITPWKYVQKHKLLFLLVEFGLNMKVLFKCVYYSFLLFSVFMAYLIYFLSWSHTLRLVLFETLKN